MAVDPVCHYKDMRFLNNRFFPAASKNRTGFLRGFDLSLYLCWENCITNSAFGDIMEMCSVKCDVTIQNST